MMKMLYLPAVLGLFAMTLAACAQGEPASTRVGALQFSGDRVVLNTTTDGRHTMISGYVGGEGPYNFLIDTGSTPNAIDENIATAMGLTVVDQQEVMSGGTVPMMVDIVEVPEITLGGLSVQGAGFITMPMAEMSAGQFHGMLGMDLFKELMISYDAHNNQITVSTDSLDASAPGVVALETESGGFRINLDVAGELRPFHVDTGSPSGFTFPASALDTVPVQGDITRGPDARLAGGTREIHEATLDGDIMMGGNVYSNPDIRFMGLAEVGNLGGAVLNQFTLRIDQKNGLLALQPPRTEAASTGAVRQAAVSAPASQPRRIGVRFRGRPMDDIFVATDVMPGSLGEGAGLMVGDVLVDLNGRPIADYTMQTLGDLFRSDAPLRFEVMRDGERQILEIG